MTAAANNKRLSPTKGAAIKKSQKKLFSLIAIGSLISIGVVAAMQHGAFARQVYDWKLTPRHQQFTELYFAEHEQLLIALKPMTAQKLAFTIRNAERQPTTYSYEITARSESGPERQLSKGLVTLAHDRSRTIERIVIVPALGKRVAIKVALQYESRNDAHQPPRIQTQSIHSWVNIIPYTATKE